LWQATEESLVGLVANPKEVAWLALMRWHLDAEYAEKDGFGGCEHRRLFADPQYVIWRASYAWQLIAELGHGNPDAVGSPEY
jgi:hypothetical protein